MIDVPRGRTGLVFQSLLQDLEKPKPSAVIAPTKPTTIP
ncbi:hypothetical protein AVDCRST_MAG81-2527 [uncultured Synechococcales cyanobacterium]|uniref:Uncharacterized protein n=1 Tax=uncultured Synechococcales cyanobacterium TaxID=1936017 RepID=A0A6J4VN25_9CYAN|nr:hypothetical protein AVDCRST_MAG81-2527 [uncultured Synechococcales cyanobacterium]